MLVKFATGKGGKEQFSGLNSYQNRVNRSSPVRVHEGGELLVDVALAATVDGERLDFTTQPLVDLVVPVLHQTARCDNDSLVYQRLAVGTLPGQ
jgi:hypothetical protein